MSMFGYVSPEQAQKDKADFARKGIARGRSLVGMSFTGGVLLCAEYRSRNLHKLGEIYDHIGFGGVGKYPEFDQLRQAGIRSADLKGYQYSREDVDARSLANGYANLMGQVFTHDLKPLEVEILVAEVGVQQDGDQLFHILYDGTVLDEDGTSVLGGDADAIADRLASTYQAAADLSEALRAAVVALAGPDRSLTADDLEVAVLERASDAVRRCFRRLTDAEVAQLLAGGEVSITEPPPSDI
jgi:proteasome alpha subunit